MSGYWASQMGYVCFLCGLCFALMAMQSVVAYSRDRSTPWGLLAAFGVFGGVNEWLDMPALSVPDTLGSHTIRMLLMAASCVALLEFGRQGFNRNSRRYLGIWLLPLLVGLTGLFALLGGSRSFNPLCQYVLGFPGALLAALTVWSASGLTQRSSRPGLRIAAVAMLLYAFAAGLIVPKAEFWPATWLNHDWWLSTTGFEIQLLRMISAVGCLAGVWWYCISRSRETEERYRALFEMSRDAIKLQSIIDAAQVGILLVDGNRSIVRANKSAAELVGKETTDMAGLLPGDGLGCAHAATAPSGCGSGDKCSQCPLLQAIQQVLRTGRPCTGVEVAQDIIVDHVGKRMYFSINASPIDIQADTHVIVVIADISELKSQAQELIYKSNHDSLTGLPNRQYFEQRLNERTRVGRNLKTRRPFGLMFIDLDKFKLINDTLGHKVGDLLLEEVAARLKTCLRAEDVLARMGGDEFTVIISRYRRPEDAETAASRIIDVVSRTFTIQGHRFVIGASIGLVSYPSDGEDAQTLLRHADAAMYKAKQAGRGTSRWYTGDVDQSNQSRVETEMDIRTALEEGQFKVYYQPMVGLRDGQIHAAEALLRWEHPQKGMISPSLFIPIAEDIGLMGSIGDYVLRTACFQAVEWHRQGIELPHISVNLSTKQLLDSAWPDTVGAALADSGLRPHGLSLELTETELATDYEVTKANLRKVEELGVGLAIDDFGMGHSSLGRLKDFRVIHLKIDGSFVRNIECSESDKALLRAIIDMARGQGICVTAEWVETEAQMEILRASGCDFAQGYYISPPLPPEEFRDYAIRLAESSAHKEAA